MDKKVLALLGAGALIVLLGSYFLFFAGKSTTQNNSPTITEQTIPTISADEIGLALKPGSDGRRVVMTVTKTDDIDSLDYELSYTAKGNIPRGAIGHVDVKKGQTVTQDIYLGTCSDVCHPDSDVTNIKVVVKVNKSDGKVFQAEAKTETETSPLIFSHFGIW